MSWFKSWFKKEKEIEKNVKLKDIFVISIKFSKDYRRLTFDKEVDSSNFYNYLILQSNNFQALKKNLLNIDPSAHKITNFDLPFAINLNQIIIINRSKDMEEIYE